MTEPSYRIEAPHEPNVNDHYIARVYLGDSWLESCVGTDRAEQIAEARRYVAWHREHSDAVEVIEL